MKLYIFIESGRLGNQFFQYAYLRSIIQPNDKICLLGFDELDDIVTCSNVKRISIFGRFKRFFVCRILARVFTLLTRLQLIGTVEQKKELRNQYTEFQDEVAFSSGLISSIVYVKEGYFQSEKLISDNALNEITLRQSVIAKAENFLSMTDEQKNKYFVHVRRGDYSNWLPRGKSAMLPMEYYEKNIERLVADDAAFIFLSDDVAYVKEKFGHIPNCYFSEESANVDFAIMTKCDGGILSASSFSWWGAYWALKKNKKNGPFIAPKYWAGFGSLDWYPIGSKTSGFNYVDVQQD